MNRSLLVSASCLVLITLHADWTPPASVSNVIKVEADITTVYDPSTATWIALWQESASGSLSYSYSALSSNQADSWQTPSPINTDYPNAGSNIFGVYDPLHNHVVALWETDYMAAYPVTGGYSTDGGNTWNEIMPIMGTTVNDDVFLTDASGKLVATWVDHDSHLLYSLTSSDGGVTWDTEHEFNMANSGNDNVYSAYDSNTPDVVAGWLSRGSVGGEPITATSPDGITWGGVTPVSNSLIGNNNLFILYNASKNTTIATWTENTTNVPYSSVSTDGGSTWNTPVPISTTVSGSLDVFTAYDSLTGLTMATWADGSSQGWYALSTDGGMSWEAPARINAVSAYENVFVAFDTTNRFFLASWADSTSMLPFSSKYVFSVMPNLGGNIQRLAEYLNALVASGAAGSELIMPLTSLSQEALDSALVTMLPKPTPAFSAANTMMVLGASLMDRGSERTILRRMNPSRETALASLVEFDMDHLTAQNSNQVVPRGSTQTAAKKSAEHYAFWAQGLGEFARQSAQNQLPAFHTQTGAAVVGFDAYQDRFQITTAFSYANSTVKSTMERDTTNFYALALYGIGYIKDSFLEAGIWGVYNQYEQSRHVFFPGFDAHAHSNHTGWQCVPHFRGGYDFLCKDHFIVEPFGSLDCAFVIQNGFSERGADPYNMKQKGSTTEFLQASTGLNAYAWQDKEWGAWFFKFTGAYMYKKGFGLGKLVDESIVSMPAGFSVIAYQNGQNLFSTAAEILMRGNNGLFGTVNYEGQFGSHYISNSIYGKIGYFF